MIFFGQGWPVLTAVDKCFSVSFPHCSLGGGRGEGGGGRGGALKATEMCGMMSGGPFVSVIEIVLFASTLLAAPFTSYAG